MELRVKKTRMPTIKPSATADNLYEETQDEKAQVSRSACQRNDFREPRLLHLPIPRKALNFVTWDIWFSLINSNLLMFQGFPDSSVGKKSTCNVGDPNLIPGSGKSAGEGIRYSLQYSWASLVAQLVKNLPAVQETWVWSLGWEDPLEKRKATHSSILAWRIPWIAKSWTRLSDFHFWCSNYLVFIAKTPVYLGSFPCLFGAVSQSYLRFSTKKNLTLDFHF